MSPTSTRQRARARDHRATVEAAILDSAEAVLSEAPYRELTIEDVMARTGLSRTAFYRYFTDLDALLLRRLTEIGAELEAVASSWLEARGGPEPDFLATTMGVATLVRDHGPLLAAVETSARGQELERTWRALVAGFIDPAQQRLEAWIRDGVVQLDEPRETAKALVWMTERYLIESYRENPDLPVEVAADTLATIWWRALFPDRA